ncbi:MAG: PH domain-containing protein [Candidatus Ranarchaeia archaeon]
MYDENTRARIIKPPTKKVSTGKIFRPSKAFRNKLWLKEIILAAIVWLTLYLSGVAILYGVLIEENLAPNDFALVLGQQANIMNLWITVSTLIWLIPALVLTPKYVKSMEYSVISENGESLPEVYVKKGIFKIQRKHVPFRTITNISSYTGPLDRLFGIGNVSIETAGYSGAQAGPEQKLEGFSFYEEVKELILTELRKFQQSYTTTTEQHEKQGLSDKRKTELELLVEIRDILRTRLR